MGECGKLSSVLMNGSLEREREACSKCTREKLIVS